MPRVEEIKHRLRGLKRQEVRIRFHGERPPGASLVWDQFFDLHDMPRGKARYALSDLARMDIATYRRVVEAYLAHVYYARYLYSGMPPIGIYDPAALHDLGLPPDADSDAVKRRFRELAKRTHPDAGGDDASFIHLMETYRRLTGR